MKIEFEIIADAKPIESEVSDPPLQITFDEVFQSTVGRSTSTKNVPARIKSNSGSSNNNGNRFPGNMTDCLKCRMGEHCESVPNFCQCYSEGHKRYAKK